MAAFIGGVVWTEDAPQPSAPLGPRGAPCSRGRLAYSLRQLFANITRLAARWLQVIGFLLTGLQRH
jgi:hypothetical protein